MHTTNCLCFYIFTYLLEKNPSDLISVLPSSLEVGSGFTGSYRAMASAGWGKKKSFFKFVKVKRGSRENIGPIIVEHGHITNMQGEKVGPSMQIWFGFSFSL